MIAQNYVNNDKKIEWKSMDYSAIKNSLKRDDKHFVGTISTYRDLREEADYIIEMLNLLVFEFSTDIQKPAYFSLYFISRRPQLLKFDSKNLKKVQALLKSRKLEAMCLYFSEEEYGANSITRTDASFQIIICHKQLMEEGSFVRTFKNEVSFSVSSIYYNEKLEILVDLIKNAFVKLNGINGYMDYIHGVHLCGASLLSEYEKITLTIPDVYGDYVNKLRGYFWLTILNSNHLDQLGGVEYVEKHMPYYKIYKERMPDREQVFFCILTENIFNFDKVKYSELKSFLKPLLEKEDMRVESLYRKESRSIEDRRLVFSEQQFLELDAFNKRDEKELMEEYSRDMSRETKFLFEKCRAEARTEK